MPYVMTTDSDDPQAAARTTLLLLETRLHRLEFLLTGTSDENGIPEQVTMPQQSKETIRGRLDAVDAALGRLKRLHGPAGALIRAVERLCRAYHG
jgi:hypothetical protein